MSIMSSIVKLQFTVVYLDDMVIFPMTAQDYIAYTNMVSCTSQGTLRKDETQGKCLFYEFIDYFGHVIKPSRLEVAIDTADAIREIETPTIVI